MITVLLIVVAIAALAGAAWWIAQARIGPHDAEPDAPLPLFSARATDGLKPPTQHHISAAPPAEVLMLRQGRAIDATTPKHSRSVESPALADDDAARENGVSPHFPAFPVADARAPTAPQAAIPPGAPPPPPAASRSAGTTAAAASGAGEGGDGSATVGTIQFLPGRLEVLQGRGIAEQEVRFIRPARTGKAAEVTFGRGEGPPFTHVQLRAPTVSRLHARLVQQGNGAWALENLSATNPVIVNGVEIQRGAPPRTLHDGDRLEMGEVVFRYHAR